VIEFARNVLRLKGANSVEFDTKTPIPVIDYMHEQRNLKKAWGYYGGLGHINVQ